MGDSLEVEVARATGAAYERVAAEVDRLAAQVERDGKVLVQARETIELMLRGIRLHPHGPICDCEEDGEAALDAIDAALAPSEQPESGADER